MNTSNTKRSVGRPSAIVKFPTGTFTINSLKEKNPTLCSLTLRKYVRDGVTGGKLIRLPNRAMTKSAGRPLEQFSLKTTYEARMKNLAKANAKTPINLNSEAKPATKAPAVQAVAVQA